MPNQIPNPNDQSELTGISERNLYAAMSYLLFLVMVPLLTRRADPFVNWHARQGLVILLGFILASILSASLPALGNLLFLLLLIGNTVALVLTLQGRSWRIPGVAQLADLFRI